MEMWIEKKDCTGCGACSNICPVNAIKMVEDECGFMYPKIDNEKCINCGACKRTCPVFEKRKNSNYEKPKVYAGWSKDENTRYTSTSGGMFTEFTLPLVNEGGYVIGAAYDDNNMVKHIAVNNKTGLEKLKQSKYVQSKTGNIYKETKLLLDENKKVAFCGAPCQIVGLKNFLKKDYEHLLTIEFICRGMNSQKAYRMWLKQIENKENKRIKRVWFKYKINGWKKSPRCTRIDFEDDTYKVYNGDNNTYMTGYLGPNLYIRPSCGECKFNGVQRQADITLADFWGIKKELDNDKGTSLILINSEKGMKYFNKIKNKIFYEERNIEEIYEGNMCFNNSVTINKNSSKFLKELSDNNFDKLIKKYDNSNSTMSKVKKKVKQIITKIIK